MENGAAGIGGGEPRIDGPPPGISTMPRSGRGKGDGRAPDDLLPVGAPIPLRVRCGPRRLMASSS
jgi:hypothetical protein